MKAIPNYENYLINEDGTKVYSKKTKKYLKICSIIKHYKTRDYVQPYVNLYNGGKHKVGLLNRVMYTTFIGEIPPGFDVDHIDNDPQNNHYSNLQLLSHSENVKKCFKDDPTLKDRLSETFSGEKNPMYGKRHSKNAKQKMSESHKGKHWSLTDITKQKLSESKKGRIWINNGIINKFVKITEIPAGFVRGRM